MKNCEIKKISFGDMDAVYIISEDKRVSFTLSVSGDDRAEFGNGKVSPLIQISCLGDSTVPGFAGGITRYNSGYTMSFSLESIKEEMDGGYKTVTTTLKNDDGVVLEHVLKGTEGCRCLQLCTNVINNSKEKLVIESVSSFALSDITPYAEDEATGRLNMHRFRSRWSAEGRHEVRKIEDLMLEPSWARFALRSEKFGSVGSMPIRGFFPFLAIEDAKEGVFWGACCESSSSWQMEAVRIDEKLCIHGGLADYEYGHWRKVLSPGDSFSTPYAYITVSRGSFEDVCDRLLDMQREHLLPTQRRSSLPAIFNEYCTTWGEPSEENIRQILSVINGKNFEYFVIDAGWYADEKKGWQDNMGDWVPADYIFPNGIKHVVKMINEAGMKAGIWFELEVVGKDSDALNEEAHLLTRDGKIIISGTRRFWDMRSRWVNEYLTERVIDFLKENGFEYIKIDYNEAIGIGCDGDDSPGEGLRKNIEATKAFFRKIRECVPGIAIEVCASGGHRLEPGFMEIADYLSFSDAHEEKEIPVIAASLQRLILPSKSQIWAVLRSTDELKRVAYSVCAGMYGVLCISGEVYDLSEEQLELALAGVEFYKKASGIIANGFTKITGPEQLSNRALKEYQASVRYGENNRALAIVHSFEHEGRQTVKIELDGAYKVEEKYETGNHNIMIAGNKMTVTFEESFDAVAVLLVNSCE